MVLDLAELELQLEVYVVIHIAPSLTSMRYSLAQNATMTKVSSEVYIMLIVRVAPS